MEFALEYYSPLNYFKYWLAYSDFSVKILNFPWRSMGLPPCPLNNKLFSCVSGADPRILVENYSGERKI